MNYLPHYEFVDKIKAKISPALQDPQKLRMVTILGIGIIGLLGIGIPINLKMRAMEQKLSLEISRQAVIADIDKMKAKQRIYNKYLNKQGDLNWWIEYILGGLRQSGLKMMEYKPFDPKSKESRPGTFKGYILQFQLQGDFRGYYRFVNWVESSKYSMRISRILIQKERMGSAITGSITMAVLTSRVQKKEEKKTDIKKTKPEKMLNAGMVDISSATVRAESVVQKRKDDAGKKSKHGVVVSSATVRTIDSKMMPDKNKKRQVNQEALKQDVVIKPKGFFDKIIGLLGL